jgi:hypothetical protein
MAPDVLRLLVEDRLLSARARQEAADLLTLYPTRAELDAVLDSTETTLSTWLNVMLRCQRMFEVLAGFYQGSEESQLAIRIALRHYPDPAAIQQLCSKRVDVWHREPLVVDPEATRHAGDSQALGRGAHANPGARPTRISEPAQRLTTFMGNSQASAHLPACRESLARPMQEPDSDGPNATS